MLATLLPLLESLGAEGGATASSLGRHGGIGSTLGRLLGGSQVQAFGDQNELGGAMRQISDLTSQIAAAKESLSQMRSAHAEHEVQQQESERLYGFRDPQRADQMAALQQQQIEHARQMQLQQQQMENLQARAAVTLDPRLAAQEQRRATFGRAGAIEIGGQLGIQGARAAGSWAYQPIGEAASFLGGPAGNIANQMAGQAGGAMSNVASTATHGASLGMAVGGPVGAAVGGVAGGVAQAGIEIAKLPNKIKDWSEALLESQKPLTQFSSRLTEAAAEAERRGVLRNIESGRSTGGATAELSNNLQRLYDEIRPMRDTVTFMMARSLTTAVDLLRTIALQAQMITKGLSYMPLIGMGIKAIEANMKSSQAKEHAQSAAFLGFIGRATEPPKKPPRPSGM